MTNILTCICVVYLIYKNQKSFCMSQLVCPAFSYHPASVYLGKVSGKESVYTRDVHLKELSSEGKCSLMRGVCLWQVST